MVAGVLGVLKAGQIVVALNPDDPVSRLKMLVEDAEPSVIVTDVQNWKLAAEFARPGCRIITFESETAIGPVENPSIEILARANGVSDLHVRHNRSPKRCDENPPTASQRRCRSIRVYAVYGE